MPPDATATPVAFVTGAAGGIGKAVVARLRQRGMRVYATDLALSAIPCTESDFAAASLDVTDERAVTEAVQACARQFGQLDHVVHLAGRGGTGPLTDVSFSEWRNLLAVNLDSAFLLAKAAASALSARHGTLTLMASTNALNGGSALSGPAYAVAKAGIINLTRYLAKEWAPQGVRVNCLAPGPIDTPMVGRFAAEIRARLIQSVPLQRLGKPDEVAAAIDYLTGDGGAFITGTVMNISGGVVLD
ncbi:MAG: SDR family oxidoreductase [Steroidobacteraceae bacterium]|nr:SDR family oxidoreductase [Steroidobacteraceae bacterium]